MKIKIALLLYALTLWVVSPVLAQNNGNGNGGGNGSGKGHGHGHGHGHSDKGGPDNGSDKGGHDENGSDKGGHDENGSDEGDHDDNDQGDHDENFAQLKVETAEVVSALAIGSLATPTGVSIPNSAQATLYAVLTANVATTSPAPQVSAMLAAAGSDAVAMVPEAYAPDLARLSAALATAGPGVQATLPPLMKSLSGLAFHPARIRTVIGRYNSFVQSASASFLANPPAEFLAVHAVLARLTAAAGAK